MLVGLPRAHQRFVRCENIAEYEECVDFVEVEGEAWVIRRI